MTCKRREPQLRTVYLIGGPRDGTRTLAGGVSLTDMMHESYISGHGDDGNDYVYAILGVCENGELLAVNV